MAINKKLIHFKSKEKFNEELANANIKDTSIVFIQDSKEIWTHSQFYATPLTIEEIEAIVANSPTTEELLAKIAAETSAREKEIEDATTELTELITLELNRAQAAEETLTTNLSNEITRSTTQDEAHDAAIAKEVSDRETAITTEVNDRNNAIKVETDRAVAAEATLQSNINTLDNELDTEVSRATNAEQALQTALDSEVSRAKSAETELDGKITNHTNITDSALALKADKADTYTKDQVDQKVSGSYKVKGSSTFEDLPTEGNTVGDVYNITNIFTLDDVEYPVGTNVVYTEDGWDALSGVFDTTKLEGDIQTVADNISKETVRAKEAEAALNTSIQTETSNREAANLTLQSNIDSVNTALSEEVSRAKAAEQQNASDITTLAGRVTTNETKLGVVQGDENTTGSINKALKDAKDYTDSVVEGLDSTVSGSSANVAVEVTETDGKLVNVAVSQSDIASAETLTNVDNRLNTVESNYVTTNTQQTITAEKTFSGGIVASSQIESTITTDSGLSPITVLSTNVCNNLNADLLDGAQLTQVYWGNWYKKGPITTTKAGWYTIANCTESGLERSKVSFLIRFDGGNYTPSVAIISINVGWGGVNNDYTIISAEGQFKYLVYARIVADAALGHALLVYFNSPISGNCYLYVPSDSHSCSIGIDNWTWYYGSLSNYSDTPLEYKALTLVNGYNTTANLSALGAVAGDFVDWYGVSWSENSSDPTCTRIGNMAMHRSLPILSAMKGYLVGLFSAGFQETITPLDNAWIAPYTPWNNSEYPDHSNMLANVMVKIPEFWYIDEYVASTKTHNLKISQTAKAGWIHHKEAYVGAYEGYNDGTYYRSIKNQVPTISVTREAIRTKARANGFEDESKWNIYTYEEHRAICHLFLVEYATRNCQAAVNSTLTADGFRQGGLGSGCTTGIMNNAYSFIPTGTTDSLGNGSGQVAYTASNGTTYYANRYRGIENPFGHVWKHCDDVISQIIETGYRTVFKCEDPASFATNKNTKYKSLGSFPSGLQGYKKETKASINCDFFPYSIGGSESTYWCDYTYDNTDTSEHCLLIGGRSVDGGQAGLFSLTSAHGVGNSTANVGSRLTYLPWAK